MSDTSHSFDWRVNFCGYENTKHLLFFSGGVVRSANFTCIAISMDINCSNKCPTATFAVYVCVYYFSEVNKTGVCNCGEEKFFWISWVNDHIMGGEGTKYKNIASCSL